MSALLPFAGASLRHLSTILVLFLLVGVSSAFPDVREAGWVDLEDPRGTGIGVAFDSTDSARIQSTLSKLRGLSIEIKVGEEGNRKISGAQIADDLEKMLKDGRMGLGKGALTGTNGSTRSDGKPTTDGDRINIGDMFMRMCGWDNKKLAEVLAHEWAHTTQPGTMSQPAREAEAYQIGQAVYRLKGGPPGVGRDADMEEKIEKFKAIVNGEQEQLPDSNTPADGSEEEHGSFHNEYYLFGQPSELQIWWNDATSASITPLPLHTFFTEWTVARPGMDDRVIVFGADTSVVGAPVGWITAVDADSLDFANRDEIAVPELRHPFSVTLDRSTERWYVLDTYHGGPGICVMLDTNGDQVPDLVEPEPFAPRTFPGVAEAQFIGFAEHPVHGAGLLMYDFDARGTSEFGTSQLVKFLVDEDGDQVADQLYLLPEIEFVTFAPTIAETPHAGDTKLDVAGMPGHLIEVWATDETGDVRLELLGSILASLEVSTVTLARSLVLDEYVLPVDAITDTRPLLPRLVEGVAVPAIAPWQAGVLIVLLASAAIWGLARRGRPRSAA